METARGLSCALPVTADNGVWDSGFTPPPLHPGRKYTPLYHGYPCDRSTHALRERQTFAVPGGAYETLDWITAWEGQVGGYGARAVSAPCTTPASFLAFLEPY